MKVRDLIKRIETDGWRQVSQEGSHRQYKHPAKPGRVTVPGHPGDDVAIGTLKNILRKRSWKRSKYVRYTIIIEKAGNNYSAYVPDLPGCITTGPTVEQTKRNMEEAIAFHLRGMREDGEPIPLPNSTADVVEVAA